jgi:hypothetical protein
LAAPGRGSGSRLSGNETLPFVKAKIQRETLKILKAIGRKLIRTEVATSLTTAADERKF